ncbi:MAG: hypothetical protein RL211_608 [Pseudomonadota bacterium]|jgi:rhomboid protease GluP
MKIEQSSAQPEEKIYASKKSLLALTRLGLWGGAAIAIALPAATSKSGFSWFVTLFMLSFVGFLDWFLRKQMHTGKAFATVDASGITSPAFSGKLKRFEWNDVAEVALTRVQNVPMLQLVMKASSDRPDKRNFWTGQNLTRPVLSMSALDDAAQEKLFKAIQHYVQNDKFGNAPLRFDNQIASEKEFQDRLKSLAPVPWLIYGLIGVNVAIWLASLPYGASIAGSPTDLLLGWGGNAASEVQRGEWWRLVSAMFLHNGLMQVALNMLGLYGVGITVERIYGRRLFALIYFGSGLVGGALSLHFAAQNAVSVGASGAVFGVTGALLIGMLQHRSYLPKTMGRQTLGSMGFFILYSLVQGFTRPGIDNAAHIGGLLAGCLLAYIFPERFNLEKFVQYQKSRALIGLFVAIGATAALASLAPTAQVDQRESMLFVDGMRKMSAALQAMQREAEQVKAGKMSERESDDRSRTVFAPMMRDVVVALNKAQLPNTDLRQPLLTDARRMSALLIESLEMASVIPEGSTKPQPINLVRAAEIEKEILLISQRFAKLQTSMQDGMKR